MVDETTRDEPIATGDNGTLSRGKLLKAGAVAAGALAGAGLIDQPKIALGSFLRKRKLKIAIVPKGLSNPVFNTANYGGQQRALELGDVDFHFTGPSKSDAAEQVTAIDALITAGYDGIGISCDASQTMVDPINRAIKKGIKVITWDSDAPASNRSVFYGVNSYEGGKLQATLLNGLLKGKSGDIWLLSGLPTAQNLNDRIRGVKAVLSKDLRIAGTSFCNEDGALGVQQVETVLQSHPNLAGYIMIGAWPLFTSEGAMPTLRKRAAAGLQVVAFDYLLQELPFIQHGTVKASVGQDYYGWGYQSVQILYELIQGKHYPAFVPQSLPVVTKANVQQYYAKWAIAKDRAGAAKAFAEAPIQPS